MQNEDTQKNLGSTVVRVTGIENKMKTMFRFSNCESDVEINKL